MRRIGPVAYEIALPPHLGNLHNVFHVSQLRKYVADPTHVLEQDDVQVRENLTLGVRPVRILDSQVKQLRGKEIWTVKAMVANRRRRSGGADDIAEAIHRMVDAMQPPVAA
ncbi:uncharacterized protein LOC114188303 [Vigna unguiculata]|uniref:uncharacterized protein LOC114188303 n=1 Tax=Vigna unguiculata TaxID=3917 RepID=UPI001016C7E2|nr:uncharacterized protein LOC114188303 [Vigna unguiculata]